MQHVQEKYIFTMQNYPVQINGYQSNSEYYKVYSVKSLTVPFYIKHINTIRLKNIFI